MGYESRLYVIDKCEHESLKHDGKFWGQVIASFDLSRIDEEPLEKFLSYPQTDCYIFAGDRGEVSTDMYGEPIREMPLEDAIEILEDAEIKEHYRRYLPCIGMLKGFHKKDWGNLVVLHYGY